jgi:AcrR family transcriptional regulator
MSEEEPKAGRSRRQERKEQTREELVGAAARVFARKGFHQTTIADVAEEAGYSTGAIYVHFAGKDELFLEVAANYVSTRARENQGVRDEAGGRLPQRAKALGDHWMARLAEDPSYMFLSFEFLGYARNKPELRAQLAPRTAAGRDQIAQMIAEAAERDGIELPMSAEDLGIVMRELGGGLAMAKLIDPDAFRDELFGEFLQTFFSLLPGRTLSTPRNLEGAS